ncbi:MAG: hypothetical protein ACKPBT_01625 [Microcystis aeruginosa]
MAISLLPVDQPDFFLKPLYQLSVISYQLSDLSFKRAVCIKWEVLNTADSALVWYIFQFPTVFLLFTVY